MGTLLYMAPEQTKNYSYGKVKVIVLNLVENRHVGVWNNNVHAD